MPDSFSMNLDNQLAWTEPPSEALDEHRRGVLRGATGRTEAFGNAREPHGLGPAASESELFSPSPGAGVTHTCKAPVTWCPLRGGPEAQKPGRD